MNIPVFSGVLLAGGHSSRMGSDKALIEVKGVPLWQLCRDTLAAVCETILISGDRPDLASDDLRHYTDAYPGSSLAGLHTALTHAPTDWVTVLPCDLPFPSPGLLRRLQKTCAEGVVDAVVPRTCLGREPLIACYHKSALKKITERLTSDRPKILDLLDELKVRYVDEDELPAGWRRALRNINSPADLKNLTAPPPVISLIANSGTGKTTLIEKLIVGLTANGWTVGALKHDSHDFEIDHAGKDSWRMTEAGAAMTAISSSAKTAIIQRHETPLLLDELLNRFQGAVDLILTEGFRKSSLPKIEVHRSSLNQPLLSRGLHDDPTLVAVATDSGAHLELDVPIFDLNEVTELCHFIEERFLL